eukprot:TRINITY_DN37498_c0_g1_i1.p1 TRINITY_DN37498_c0_g1~~TRINITY_DN37498_c0_g1_i1.p1  ORF type:complete len:888 (-),score=213.35 TRINITY_DN37498_c0_g1_i1:72-2735(-)
MSSPNGRDLPEDLPAEEDVLGDDRRSEEEGEGDDLFGDDMMDDYAEDPELDQLDPDIVDDRPQEPLSIEQRMAAERAMNERDEGPRRRPRSPRTPGFPVGREPTSPGLGSDLETPGSGRRVRRRIGAADTPARSESQREEDDDEEEDVPESYYDLNNDNIDKNDETIDARVEAKIRKSFTQFLRKFVAKTDREPTYPDELRRMAEENEMHLDVNFVHLQEWSAKLALFISEDPIKLLPLLNQELMNEAARKFATYRDIKSGTEENQLRVAIHSFPIQDKIRELDTKSMNKLVQVAGVATKRSTVYNEVNRLFLRCGKCNAPCGPFEVAQGKELKPGACVECQSRGPWRVDRQHTLYRNFQKITLQESPSTVEPGKMPRSKEVILHGDQADSVRPGDDVVVTGIYRCLFDAATNARTCFPVYKTEIESVHVRRKGDLKMHEMTDDVLNQILDLAKQPNIRERIIASVAPSIYGMRHVKTAIVMSMMGGKRKEAAGKHRIRGDINVLIVGDPGLAKSQFLKYVEQTSPKAVYTTGKGASAVGLTAALTRDEKGDWALEGGAMVLADDGICLIDEFDKMNDQDRVSIHEAMEQQSISISKAGIVATLQARCAVIAVANPTEGRYDPQQTFAQNVGLTDPILSRFDVLCVLRDEADAVQDERLADHVVCSHIRSHPEASPEEKLKKPRLQQREAIEEPIPQELLQKYIQYARTQVHPKVLDMDKDKLANFYKEIRSAAFASGGAPMTARHVESIIRLSEANARLELRQHVTSKDLDYAIGLMLESFVQSQKHQVAEELRTKFRRYIAASAPVVEHVMVMLDKLFREKLEQKRLLRADGLPPDVSEVPIGMNEVVKEAERQSISLDEVYKFMATDRFKRNFRESGENLFRVV